MPEKILSICIPTFNRADILDNTLSELVKEPSFHSGKFEICISDNASPDHTQAVVQRYTAKYQNIIYSKNKKNTVIIDGNFPIVAAMASGTFIKFLNDYAHFIPGELDRIIEFIEANKEEKPVLFFSNNNILDKTNEIIFCDSLNSFVKEASFLITWVLAAGTWRDDFLIIQDRDRSVDKFMWCPDLYLRLMSAGRKAVIYNRKFSKLHKLSSKGGYNIYHVFVTNYLGLYDEYIVKKQITRNTLFNEKTKLMRYFLIPWTLSFLNDKTKYSFEKQDAFSIVFQKYRLHPVFYLGSIYILIRVIFNQFMNFAIKK